MAFCPVPLVRNEAVVAQLAVARSSTIELWTCTLPDGSWIHEKTMYIPVSRPELSPSLGSLIWSVELISEEDVIMKTPSTRLFSAGMTGCLTEWDIDLLYPKKTISVDGGPVWSMALSHDNQFLALGCEDGSIRLIDMALQTLEVSRIFEKQDARILSLYWVNGLENNLISGGADGLVRIWDCQQGRTIRTINLSPAKEKRMVWNVLCIPEKQGQKDSIIVTADSNGGVSLWDFNTCALIQSLLSHEADVMALAASYVDGEPVVFASGVDYKITMFKPAGSRWIEVCHRRSHSHDVHVLLTSPSYFNQPCILSAGIDTMILQHAIPNLVRIHQFGSYPQRSPIKCSQDILLLPYENQIQLWRLDFSPQCTFEATLNNDILLSVYTKDALVIVTKAHDMVLFTFSSQWERSKATRIDACHIKDVCFYRDKIIVLTADSLQLFSLGLKFLDCLSIEQPLFLSSSLKQIAVATETHLLIFKATKALTCLFQMELRNLNPCHLFSMNFHSTEPYILLMVFQDKSFILFDTQKQCMDGFTSKHPLKLASLPISMTSNAATVLFGLQSEVVYLDLSKPLSSATLKKLPTQPLLHVSFTGDNVILFERPWASVLEHLPPPFQRIRYGQ